MKIKFFKMSVIGDNNAIVWKCWDLPVVDEYWTMPETALVFSPELWKQSLIQPIL